MVNNKDGWNLHDGSDMDMIGLMPPAKGQGQPAFSPKSRLRRFFCSVLSRGTFSAQQINKVLPCLDMRYRSTVQLRQVPTAAPRARPTSKPCPSQLSGGCVPPEVAGLVDGCGIVCTRGRPSECQCAACTHVLWVTAHRPDRKIEILNPKWQRHKDAQSLESPLPDHFQRAMRNQSERLAAVLGLSCLLLCIAKPRPQPQTRKKLS